MSLIIDAVYFISAAVFSHSWVDSVESVPQTHRLVVQEVLLYFVYKLIGRRW